MLNALSPLDGRYESKIEELKEFFSESALIKYRVHVEIKYFLQLKRIGLDQLTPLTSKAEKILNEIIDLFSEADAESVKKIERTTNHDVKAVEYFIKEKMVAAGLADEIEFIHFGLTSQDINNTAFPMMIKGGLQKVLIPAIKQTIQEINEYVKEFKDVPMLARTHGQAASPTSLGKEFAVFEERLTDQLHILETLPIKAKFGGATGNFNAHKVSFPEINWIDFGDNFVNELGLIRSQKTTQIAHYDHLAALFMCISRINNILIDYCRDIWTYISMDYFKQKVVKNEVGSSAMPHKVNPIDFENAEGNLGIANALLTHLAHKLPISRLQRDLTDSTVLRNVGVPFGHCLIALKSISKGNRKLKLNQEKLNQDLDDNWAVVSEAIQNILRREGVEKPYELLKELTRGKSKIQQSDIKEFINNLQVKDSVQKELKQITPHNYVGYR